MARLLLVSGGERREYRISHALHIGRRKDADIFLDDRLLSREHTAIYHEALPKGGAEYSVKDLGSRNGTFLNGKKIQQTEKLSDGDKIRIGEYVFEFKVEPQDRRRKTGPRKAPRTAAALPAFAFYGFLLFLLLGATVTSKFVFVWAYQQVLLG